MNAAHRRCLRTNGRDPRRLAARTSWHLWTLRRHRWLAPRCLALLASTFHVLTLEKALLLLAAVMLASCTTFSVQPEPAVLCRSFQRGPLAVHADLDLDEHHPLFAELIALESELAETLHAPPVDTQVHLHLFASPATLAEFARHAFPGVTPRSAWFVAGRDRQTVYAVWGPQVGVDLRHEMTHAYLHAAWPSLPLWLDEGLAEFFEQPAASRGGQPAHAQGLLDAQAQGRWQPDLKRLEAKQHVADLSAQDYAESWAWVHWLLSGPPASRSLLIEHLQRRQHDPTAALVPQIREQFPGAVDALITHLRAALVSSPASSAPALPPTHPPGASLR